MSRFRVLVAANPVAWAILLMAALGYVLFVHRLTERDLWGSHEARAAQDAGSMLDHHDWSLPRLTDERADLQKPPMYYWLVAAIARLRGGVDAWAVRLPAAGSSILCVLLVGGVLFRRGRPTAALMAAIALMSAQHFTWLARTARIDMPLTLCVTAACFTIGLSRRWQIIGCLAIATGILLKGPIGFVLPFLVVGADRLMERRLNGVSFGWRPLIGCLALALVIALPWFIRANIQTNGEFFRIFFWYHNVQRATGEGENLAVHPWWFYGPRLLVDALPWSLLLIPAMIAFARGRVWRLDREARFGLVWLFVVTGVLSCARFKRADYLLPAYPGLAIFLGCLGERAYQSVGPSARRAGVTTLGMLLAATIGGWLYVIHVEHPRLEPRREQRSFARAIRTIAPAPAVVLLFRVECHPLAFHLGRPINSLLEWENLDWWAGRPIPTYVLMTPEDAAEWPQHLWAGELDEVLRTTDVAGGAHERPLILMRTRPKTETPHAAPREQAAHRPITDQHGPSGPKSGSSDRTGRDRMGECPGQAQAAIRAAAGG